MSGQSESVIDKMRAELNARVARDVSIPSGTDAEKFFKTFCGSGSSKASAKVCSIRNPFSVKNWSRFTPSVTGVAAGATGVLASAAGVETVAAGFTQMADGITVDGNLLDVKTIADKRSVAAERLQANAAEELVRAAINAHTAENRGEGGVANDIGGEVNPP